MSAQYTDITILLDRSGSMESIKAAMESALAEFLTAHKAVPSTRVSLIQFDAIDSYEECYIDVPVKDAPAVVIVPREMTPLCDALCRTIDHAGERLSKKAEAERPDQVLFVIITDGLENASRTYTRKDVAKRITEQTNTYHWQFIYLGANQDAIQEAASFGIQADHAMAYAASGSGVRGMSVGVAANSVAYAAQQVNRGETRSLTFNTMQRSTAMAEDDPFAHLSKVPGEPGETQLPLPLDDETTS